MSTNDIRKKAATAAVGAAALAVGAVAGQMLAAPMAHADRTVTAQEICSERGQVAKVNWTTIPLEGYCGSALSIVPGFLWAANENPIASRVPPGSYKVNPLDPLSDWVIPG